MEGGGQINFKKHTRSFMIYLGKTKRHRILPKPKSFRLLAGDNHWLSLSFPRFYFVPRQNRLRSKSIFRHRPSSPYIRIEKERERDRDGVIFIILRHPPGSGKVFVISGLVRTIRYFTLFLAMTWVGGHETEPLWRDASFTLLKNGFVDNGGGTYLIVMQNGACVVYTRLEMPYQSMIMSSWLHVSESSLEV